VGCGEVQRNSHVGKAVLQDLKDPVIGTNQTSAAFRSTVRNNYNGLKGCNESEMAKR